MTREAEPDPNTIRETYTEHSVGDQKVAEIADPDNDDAWITSSTTSTIER